MRILLWCDSFWPEIGGLEVLCVELIRGLVRRGHACAVITDIRTETGQARSAELGDVPIHRLPLRDCLMTSDLKAVRALRREVARLVDDFNPDVIHVNAHHCSVYYFIQQQRARYTPSILTLHDRYLFEPGGPLGNYLLDHAHSLIAISESMQRDILRFNSGLESKLHLIPNSLSLPNVEPAPLPWPPKLMAFGRIVRDKGFDLALEAFARIAPEFPGVNLTIAGDGVELDDLKRLAKKLGLVGRVEFPGWIDPHDIPALLNLHSVVLIPVRWQEPFGLVVLQSAQMGRPVVASASGAIPEIVSEGETGSLFEIENIPDFSSKLRALLQDRNRMEAWGRQARARACGKFGFNRFIASYEERYAAAIAAAKKSG